MKILQLVLHKYLRFSVLGINHFKYDPETVIQLILGPNGSGKSSLLKELSPLPPDLKNEFSIGGYKFIKIAHNNSIYDLLCERGEKETVFSFIKDGNELNAGHTVTIFRDLVRVEFGIVPDIHELMTGTLRFTEMDVATRRSWFTRLPSTDYTYAIKYYKKLSEALRDTTGAIKHVYSRLLQEKEKAISGDELEEIREDLKHLKDYLAFILENKKVVPYSVTETEDYISRANKDIEYCTKRISSLVSMFDNAYNCRDISELVEKRQEIQSQIAANVQLLSHIFEEAQKLEYSIDELERNQADSVEQLQQKMGERKQYIVKLMSHLQLGLEFRDPKATLDQLDAVSPYLVETVMDLQPDPDRKLGREYHEQLTLRHNSLETAKVNLTENLTFLNNRRKELEHIKTHDNIECPECSHVFNRGFNQTEYEELLRAITSVERRVSENELSIKQSIQDLEEIARRFELLRGFSQLTKGYPLLDSFWDYYRSKCLFDNPNGTYALLESLRADLNILTEVQKLMSDEKQEEETLKTMLSFKNASLADLKKEYESKSSEMYRLQEAKTNLTRKLQSLDKALEIAREVSELKTELETALENRKEKMDNLTDAIRNELRGKMIQAVQMEITIRENRISSITSHQRVLEEFESQLEKLKQKKELLHAASKILSPSEGLIAKGITGFINHFVGQMNNFIKKIWSYPLELVPIVPDENLDLDYKFALKVGDTGSSPDISKLSRGQKEIIDLAFKVIAAQYLHLGHSPLYLDEFGSSFDKEHRQTVSEMMHSLTNTSSFSQVFIISHYEEMYGSFKNTDITVFHDPQLQVMSDNAFNKIATFA